RREIDCGQGVSVADLALGPGDTIRFERGTITNLALHIPSRALVPGLPGGPSCQLAFDARTEIAYLNASSVCSDDHGADIVVAQGTANNRWRPDTVYLATDTTTTQGCHGTAS